MSPTLSRIQRERDRQDRLKAAGRFTHTCADEIPNARRFLILTEEVGEVARAVLGNEGAVQDGGDLEAELVQVAAICVAWLEGLA